MGREPRPLLVGFLHHHHSELIQNNSWKLSELSDPGMRTVSVVKDLTMKQRSGKKELLREAARKNCDRNQEELERNIAHKVVGRRGSKREILCPLRFGEKEERQRGWQTSQGEKVESRVSPEPAFTPVYPNLIELLSPKHSKDHGRGVEEGEQEEEVVDDAEEVC